MSIDEVLGNQRRWHIECGNALDVLRRIPSGVVHVVVTSPPYYGLRDYGTASWDGGSVDCDHLESKESRTEASKASSSLGGGKGNTHRSHTYGAVCNRCGARRVDQQIGLEDSPEAFVDSLVEVFREVRRVLHPSGTAWIVIGDSYSSGGRTGHGTRDGNLQETNRGMNGSQDPPRPPIPAGIKSKDRLGMPHRLVFALQDDGWWWRDEIVWAKTSPMPESVQDRCTKSSEFVFMLAKQGRYFYDREAIAEASVSPEAIKGYRPRNKTRAMDEGSGVPADTRMGFTNIGGKIYDTRNKRSVWTIEDHTALASWLAENHPEQLDAYLQQSTNRTSVWTVSSESFSGAHFAVFPTALVMPMVQAGTSERGCCPQCLAPWERIVERDRRATRPGENTKVTARGGASPVVGTSGEYANDGRAQFRSTAEVGNRDPQRHCTTTQTVGWQPTCKCDAGEPQPCLVLDPFCGAGTTGVVTLRLGRSFLGAELNPDYAKMARRRIADDSPLFN